MASSSSLREFLDKLNDDYVSCAICLEQCKKPKILPCLHTFCEDCLEQLVEQTHARRFRCPTCKSMCTSCIGSLKGNHFMVSLIDLVNENREKEAVVLCDVCATNAANHICVDCSKDLCETCINEHRTTLSHQVLTLQECTELKVEKEVSWYSILDHCLKHTNNRLDYFCESCNVDICFECTIIDHRVPQHVHRYAEHKSQSRDDDDIAHETFNALKRKDCMDDNSSVVNSNPIKTRKMAHKEINQRQFVWVSKCGIGSIPRRLLKGDTANIIITTRNKHGIPVMSRQQIIVKVVKPDGSNCDGVLIDNHDGTYTVPVRGEIGGKYVVTMTIRDQHIPGTPVKIVVDQSVVMKIGKQGHGNKEFYFPNQIVVNRKGDFAIADTDNGRLQIVSQTGRYKKTILLPQSMKPTAIAMSNGDKYFTTDASNNEVVVLGNNGVILKSFGNDRLAFPLGIAISPQNSDVYVTNSGCGTIEIYTQEGDFVRSFGSRGNLGGQFSCPYSIAFDSHGVAYVSDSYNHRIQVFSSDSRFLYTFGSIGKNDGQFYYPRGVAIDNDRYVYVTDQENRLQKFDSTGRFIRRIDNVNDHGLNMPTGIAFIGNSPMKIIVVDTNNHCIKIFVP
ncbi:tripartite motif-containing protein 2-like [Saccoglossus kowalevskii]|uniref:Tripartite motif-containing protein 2-like n=1 Tax=Saccoglossus kowalevskii TaxID=10224 RepID=A0ABM0MBT2_SACKO|nr:PREDICTED: tripartite motif-containing protein 2-like [Saccoglossus kowalevskii]